jgi:hypothetical protein
VTALRELGFTEEEGEQASDRSVEAEHRKVRRTAPIQQRQWVSSLAVQWAKPFFSPAAWMLYALAFVFSACCFIIQPDLLPRPQDTFMLENRGLALLILVPLSFFQTALHEMWHWLGARAAGVSARFGIDRRLCFLVFETDLSQLWSLPRRMRYGPQLAGMAIDSLLLAVLLVAQILDESGLLQLPQPVRNAAAALAFLTLASLVWQTMIFLRTDLYGVLVTATGCSNLWTVKNLLLRQAFGRLSTEQRDQLAMAHPRDIKIGHWFRWIYLLGIPLALGYFGVFHIPVLLGALEWTVAGLSVGPSHGMFWATLFESLAVYLPLLLVLTTYVKSRLDRLGAVPVRS